MTRKSTLLITGILCSFLVISPANAAMGDVVLSFNARANNSTGLTWVNGYLWNIGHGHDIPAELLKLDPTDGSELFKLYLPIEHVMGLTWDGNAFWAVSHEDSVIYQLNATDGSIINSFPSPNPGTVETGCAGMAWDGQYLWYADSDLDRIYQLDPVNGAEIFSFSSPGSKPEGLAWDGMYLWHFDLITDLVYQLDSTDGSVLISFNAPGNGQGDLAWDGNYLWMSRNSADRIYKIDVGCEPPVADAGGIQTVNEGDIVQFDGLNSYDPDGTITTYNWDFDANMDSDGDNNLTNDIDATGPIPTHIYGDDGVYIVTLTVIDNVNLSGTDTCIVTVNNLPPTIEPFGPFVVDKGVPLTLNVNAIDPGSDDLTFTWSWGDGTFDTITFYYNNGTGPDPYPSPWGTFPFNVTDFVQHIYDTDGIYTINLTVEDDDGGVKVYTTNITVINIGPPVLYINVSLDGKNVILYWDQLSTLGIDHYLIYRSTSQTDFDFNTEWKNTSMDKESGEPSPIPLRTMWNDTNAAFPGNTTNYEKQYYYVIRAVNVLVEVSSTSRTVGKWTKVFPKGISTFSLPLEPLEIIDTDNLTSNMGAEYIKYLNSTTHNWNQHDLGGGAINNTEMKLGEGFEVKFQNQTNFTFCGMPGAMILYKNISFGFDATPKSDAGNLTAQVNSGSETVVLNWEQPENMGSLDQYIILRSNQRDGFWGVPGQDYIELAVLPYNISFYLDEENASSGTELYYMIVTVNGSTLKRGSSSYSIGVWTKEFQTQYDTIGLPLKLTEEKSADWYCDNIPKCVGINYHNPIDQRWRWHSTRMPQGAFDPVLEMAEGYQISTSGSTKFSFVGR